LRPRLVVVGDLVLMPVTSAMASLPGLTYRMAVRGVLCRVLAVFRSHPYLVCPR
jgi:hypothetical protein